uniref:ChaC-like family protein n=1 Tax=Tanacetum cinerariifolium TaxID=118510 RepID=A0A699IZK3_TANCI|nr:ChaC-like family protein [Tanacetum cinerariifolium]
MDLSFMAYHRSLKDEVNKISTSIFITNFPDHYYAKDLWKACNQYGNVVDAFILNKKSKSGKRFGFVHFIKVLNVDRLVDNLCRIWIDRFKLYANKARFQRPLQNNNNTHYTNKGEKGHALTVVKKESGLPWATKENFKATVGIGSWFSRLKQASNLFHIDERVTWVDIGEVSGWTPHFMDEEVEDSDSDDENREDSYHDKNADKNEYAGDTKEAIKEGDEGFQNSQYEKASFEVGRTCYSNSSKNDKEESTCFGHFKKVNLPRSGGSMLQLII